jgi:hypothetical protein
VAAAGWMCGRGVGSGTLWASAGAAAKPVANPANNTAIAKFRPPVRAFPYPMNFSASRAPRDLRII